MSYPDDPAAKIDRAVYREHARMTAGASAFHCLDPSEMVMRLEEAAADPASLAIHEREVLRAEVFSGFAEYLFAEGPDPREVRRRVEGLFLSFIPELAAKLKGPREWVADALVERVLAKHAAKLDAARDAASPHSGALSTWVRSLRREVDFEFIETTIAALVRLLTAEGATWRLVTSTAFCLAKALRPQLIADMSLEDIARLSGDLGGRATPSDRIKRLYNRRLEAAGAKGSFVHFQKSASAVAAMTAAQKGNRNRRRAKRRKSIPPKP
jgi:hypothetical protein